MKNVGGIDQKLRIILGLLLFLLSATTNVIGLWGLLGVVPLITGWMGYCPLYQVVGVKTCKS